MLHLSVTQGWLGTTFHLYITQQQPNHSLIHLSLFIQALIKLYPPAYSSYINNHLYTSNILIFNKLINVFLFALKLLFYKYFTAIIHFKVIIILSSQALLFWCCDEEGEVGDCGAAQYSDWLVGSLMNTPHQHGESLALPDCGMS